MAKVVKIINAIGAEINSEQYIDETMKIGKYKSMSTRPIMMKMTTGESKMEILRKAKKLKSTNTGIDEDFTKKVQEERTNT